jgi:hypothetical protein
VQGLDDASAGATEPGEKRRSDRGLVIPLYLSLSPVLCHWGDGNLAVSLTALLQQVQPRRIDNGAGWQSGHQVVKRIKHRLIWLRNGLYSTEVELSWPKFVFGQYDLTVASDTGVIVPDRGLPAPSSAAAAR